MTELETIERAKMYMDKLSAGINPLDGARIPDGDIANHVRLSRCFRFISDILGRVIENGGVTPPPVKSKDKLSFSLTPEERSRFHFSTTPIPASEIAKRLNALTDRADMGKISYMKITVWLMDAGFLEPLTMPDGKDARRPTAAGNALGIPVEERTGATETYQVVVYDLQAQHFVVDNLEAIMAFDQIRLERQGQPWSPEEDTQLRELKVSEE